MTDEAMAAVLASRDDEVRVLGVFDAANKKEAAIELRRLGDAVHFIANASVLGYDVRSAMIFYGNAGVPSLRAQHCEQLWAKYSTLLVEPDCSS
ncbi:hypothetical protein NKI51_09355 [Mesorhizobium australicum]|jgi:hypothetical protein|uniref:Uncharacterized protein n=1 Tax=Mesorhizobium australicum TaxID=536018 RepID=A0ACC6T8V9_9HYPH|nr:MULTISPECIES: hypothetical protein [unclassified Mesorhizobium]ESY89130.1 hypothetical protein X739_04325 [Mesorhizobium sp. LNHC220B00]ESY91500.1 hypothetical protein X741_22965 [Mesorhizobium sp. LNHC229A00]ESZ00102.1 hypothetical protein X738_11795 [Mesorhizobium sp. LNHC209A00]